MLMCNTLVKKISRSENVFPPVPEYVTGNEIQLERPFAFLDYHNPKTMSTPPFLDRTVAEEEGALLPRESTRLATIEDVVLTPEELESVITDCPETISNKLRGL
ncbi:hypothetical protein DPMN_164942 [Dreissena polymorpha]|uniref:Uncharacterized protein n=1 Tax=Dreissena polymorpha TaxID=45954 RepID=A0A9D4IU58_DREPO|nr:hypothetical protein DPMN_164942 [Dreissena polymorpha]